MRSDHFVPMAPRPGPALGFRGPAPPPAPHRAVMHALLVILAASLALAPTARAGGASRQIVVQLSPGAGSAPGFAARSVGALPTAVRTRFTALGVRATRAFAEQVAAGARPLPGAFNFHPER